MIRENRQSITNQPVEFEKLPVEVQDCRKMTARFKGIYEIYSDLMEENGRMSTCNWFDLQTLGSQLIKPKNLSHHWLEELAIVQASYVISSQNSQTYITRLCQG